MWDVSAFIARSVFVAADDLAVDDDTEAMGSVFERIAVEDRHVSVLSDFQRTDSVADLQDLGRIDGDRGERLLERQAVGRGQRRFEQHYARLGNIGLLSALERDADS